MMNTARLTIIFLVGLIGCEARILRWVPNTDFDAARNWQLGRPPCHNEHVYFPPTTVSVFVQRNNTMLEMVLPNDGEIVLGEDVFLTFQSAPDNDVTCAEQDVFYNGSDSRSASWYDVSNWCEADEDELCMSNVPRRLHTEQIPCSYDDVVFPYESRFVVDIDSAADIRVTTIRIGDQQLTTSELRERIDDVQQRQFVRSSTGGDTTITVSDINWCHDVTGCACNNQQLKDKVCEIETSRCVTLYCNDPVTPRAHCCVVCGAVLTLQYGSEFRLNAVNVLLKNSFSQAVLTSNASSDETDDVGSVWWIVSKVGSGSETEIQVVIADDGDGLSAKLVAYDVRHLIEKDMNESQALGVTELKMIMSGSPKPSAHSHTGGMSRAPSPGITALIVIVVIIIVLAIAGSVACYVLRRQGRRMPSISLAELVRWRPRGGRGSTSLGDMELGRRGVVFDNRIIFDVSGTSFDNLTYGNQPRGELEVQPGLVAECGFDNPMYGTGALQEGFGVPPAERSAPAVRSASRLDSLPLVSKVTGMLRGLRFNAATQKLEETPTGTGNDVNDNQKSFDDDEPALPAELGYDVPSAAADGRRSKMEGLRKMWKSGRRERDGGEKHQKMDEDSTDSDEDLTGKTARKLAKQMGDKGFGNPCYDQGPIDLQPVTTATTTPRSESAAATAAETDSYRTGFANPMFEKKEKKDEMMKAPAADDHED